MIPRRLSVHDADFNWELGQAIEVKLDGEVQSEVISYDIDAGVITRCKRDAEGKPIIDLVAEEWVTETMTGAVEVSLKAPAQGADDAQGRGGGRVENQGRSAS